MDSLTQALNDEDQSVRHEILEALEKTGGLAVSEVIGEALRSKWSDVRCSTIKALGNAGGPKAIEALTEMLLRDEDSSVRYSVVTALGSIGDSEAIDGLIEALKDEDYRVGSHAARVLGESAQLGPATIVQLINMMYGEEAVACLAADVLGAVGGPTALEALMQRLNDKQKSNSVDEHYHFNSAVEAALRKTGGPEALKLLIEALCSPSEEVCCSAAEALGEIQSPKATKALIQACYDGRRSVRHKAVKALRGVRGPDVVRALMRLLDDKADIVRKEAEYQLERMRVCEAIPLLIRAIRHSDGDVKHLATYTLKELGAAEVVTSIEDEHARKPFIDHVIPDTAIVSEDSKKQTEFIETLIQEYSNQYGPNVDTLVGELWGNCVSARRRIRDVLIQTGRTHRIPVCPNLLGEYLQTKSPMDSLSKSLEDLAELLDPNLRSRDQEC